jgi:hypothetical protein
MPPALEVLIAHHHPNCKEQHRTSNLCRIHGDILFGCKAKDSRRNRHPDHENDIDRLFPGFRDRALDRREIADLQGHAAAWPVRRTFRMAAGALLALLVLVRVFAPAFFAAIQLSDGYGTGAAWKRAFVFSLMSCHRNSPLA